MYPTKEQREEYKKRNNEIKNFINSIADELANILKEGDIILESDEDFLGLLEYGGFSWFKDNFIFELRKGGGASSEGQEILQEWVLDLENEEFSIKYTKKARPNLLNENYGKFLETK